MLRIASLLDFSLTPQRRRLMSLLSTPEGKECLQSSIIDIGSAVVVCTVQPTHVMLVGCLLAIGRCCWPGDRGNRICSMLVNVKRRGVVVLVGAG